MGREKPLWCDPGIARWPALSVDGDPAEAIERDRSRVADGDPLALEQAALKRGTDRIENADLGGGASAFANHALPRHRGPGRGLLQEPQRAADLSGAPRDPRQLGDLAVGCHPAPGNRAHDLVDALVDELCGGGSQDQATLRLPPVRVNVLYFAVFRERLGREHQELELPEGASVESAIAALENEHEVIRGLRGRYRVALNQEMISGDPPLSDGDELVLIPPVAGGSRHVRMCEAPSLDRVVAAVSGPTMGGLVTFVGTVRDHSQGREVTRLEYEAYEPMAIAVMDEIASEIEGELPGVRVAVEHATGVLSIGDVAVAIACAAPHRAEAFTACRAMIDRLKERAPIWKKEVGPDGSSWVGLGP